MTDEFSSPASAVGIQYGDYEGALLLIAVQGIEKDVNTMYGIKDAVKVGIDVLDGPNEGDGFAETLIFPVALKAQLTGRMGQRVLGRLGKGEAKSGQKAPWKLQDPTDEDKILARKWIAENDVPPF